MPGRRRYTGLAKLVVAFDIGTTHSSVSYCILEPTKVPKVLQVTRFSEHGAACTDNKVSSVLYYDKGGALRAAGADVLRQDVIETAQKEGWTKVESWKLHLCPKHLALSIDSLPPLPSGKSVVDILTDFIKYLFNCCETCIRKCHSPSTWTSLEHSIEYILTYPSGWGEQQYLYRQAIERAGLVSRKHEGQPRVYMLTEGEAALAFCISGPFIGTTSTQGIVIIDAGGGLIGLSMFSITSDPIPCQEIAPAECRLQGSTFVNCRTRALIKKKLIGKEEDFSDEDIARCAREFDERTKLVIENDQDPAYINVESCLVNSLRRHSSSCQLKLSGEEVTGLFNDSIRAIINAFENQQKSATVPITTAFLVGGLLANGWVSSRLQSCFTDRNIQILRPKRNLKVVANGAIMSHINHDNRSIPPRRAPFGFEAIEQDLSLAEAANATLEKTVQTLHAQEKFSDDRIAHLEHENECLRALLHAHEQKHRCEVLHGNGCVNEAAESLVKLTNEATEAVKTNRLLASWIPDFRRCCLQKLEKDADDAMNSQKYKVAVEYFSTILLLDSSGCIDILVKRSTARALMSSWEEALNDADEIIKLDPSSYRGYELRYSALHGAHRYSEAVEAFDTMLSKSGVDTIKYVDPRHEIQRTIDNTLSDMPHVLIDTTTGHLYDRQRQKKAFMTNPNYCELVSSMATQLDHPRIKGVVKKLFQYVMLSHRWDHDEPLHQKVKDISVYDLPPSSANAKLQKFCRLARNLGFRWAWSDSSCVDKSSDVVLRESLVAMFRWYRGSMLTIVHLLGVWSESQATGDLSRSIWNTRAWTYQEYVAAETIQFYTEDWKPYLGLDMFNHKVSPAIILEMQRATGVSPEEIAVLRPGLDRAREKLYLASRREATYSEDIAYSLIGIFDVTLSIMYGERNRAVGRLLEHILTGSGDASILAWTGISGSYNSCLPMNLSVYDSLVSPHIPPPIAQAEMDRITTILRSSLVDLSPAMMLHHKLNGLPLPSLTAKRLKLPGIVFPPIKLANVTEPNPPTNLHVYRATTPTFGDVQIKTADDLTGKKGLRLVHPWIRPLQDQEFSDGATALDETTQALRFVARLRQPFGALLLEQRSSMEYRRVAADSLIMVQIREDAPLARLTDNIRTIDVL